jgi:hypothetical protein
MKLARKNLREFAGAASFIEPFGMSFRRYWQTRVLCQGQIDGEELASTLPGIKEPWQGQPVTRNRPVRAPNAIEPIASTVSPVIFMLQEHWL